MINKNILQSVISKYHLGGRHNRVKWRIKDNTLTIFASEGGRACKVVLDNFPLQDSELGIFDTDKLTKLLSITNGDLMLSLQGRKELYTILDIADANFDLTYTLADSLTIGKAQWVSDPDSFEVELELDQSDIGHIIKAKSALPESQNMQITTTVDFDGSQICEFIFGDISGYSNKITYKIQGKITKDNLIIPFDSNVIKDIFNANKDMTSALLKLSEKGLLKLEFEGEGIISTYYILRNE